MAKILGKFHEQKRVLVKATITNAPLTLNRDEHTFSNSDKRVVTALIDTGATNTGICNGLAASLNLENIGTRRVLTPNQENNATHYTYAADIALKENWTSRKEYSLPKLIEAIGFNLSHQPFDLVVGLDILNLGVATFSRGNSFSFEF